MRNGNGRDGNDLGVTSSLDDRSVRREKESKKLAAYELRPRHGERCDSTQDVFFFFFFFFPVLTDKTIPLGRVKRKQHMVLL